jgi:hypothetical protein
MFLHIGDDFIINTGEIVGIFDIDAVTVTKSGREFLRNAERAGAITTVSENLPKSFIVGDGGVYFSPISAATLNSRTEKAEKITTVI